LISFDENLLTKGATMKVALSASGESLTDFVDPRFGRCLFFVIVDTNGMGVTVYSNESSGLQGSAGIQVARFLADKGVSAVITGHCGPNASLSLRGEGIKLYEGQGGIPINQALEKFIAGHLTAAGDASAFFYNRFCEEREGVSFGRGRLRRCDGLRKSERSRKQMKEVLQQQRPQRKNTQGATNITKRR
jgi:predicted Fe-Mo cluster-binding NifX family protein